MDGREFRLVLTACLGALVLAGCSARPAKYDVQVSMAENLRDPETGTYSTLKVHLIAITEYEKAQWEMKDVDAYFSEPAHSLSSEMGFSDEQRGPHTLSWEDPIWERWDGRPWLVAVTNVTMVEKQAASRRLFVPLWNTCWSSEYTNHRAPIEIEVGAHGLVFVTPPKADCP